MIAVVQRVKKASCHVEGKQISKIGNGLLILLGVANDDTEDKVLKLAERCINLRCFANSARRMNLSLIDVNGECLVISQVTLLADTDKGRRPDFSRASTPELARKLYQKFIDALNKYNISVKEGIFGAYMHIGLINDGPVTLIIEL